MNNQWWQKPELGLDEHGLFFDGIRPDELAAQAGIPLYLYSRKRIQENIERLTKALKKRTLDFRLFYAMKANRFEKVLDLIKHTDLCGIDACSPGEVKLALACGFKEQDISYTGTSLSDADLRFLSGKPDIYVNCDSLSMMRRFAAIGGPRSIGIRINPDIGLGYQQNKLLRYSGGNTTKFGIYYDRIEEARDLAENHGLKISGIHFHCGCGYLNGDLDNMESILQGLLSFINMFPDVDHLNIGGGLGVPLSQNDKPLDLEAWSSLMEKHLQRREVNLWVEPGDYIVKDAGILIVQINTVEQRQDTLFVGVNAGFNIHIEPAFYNLPLHVVPCRPRPGSKQRVTIAGNINEALDVFGRNILLSPVKEGDYLALLNAGGYGSSMSSNHCCRGSFLEKMVP